MRLDFILLFQCCLCPLLCIRVQDNFSDSIETNNPYFFHPTQNKENVKSQKEAYFQPVCLFCSEVGLL